MIELPITIRAPRKDEVPANSSASKRLEKLRDANIHEGYKLFRNLRTSESPLFDIYAEININNSRLWDLILSLSQELPTIIALIFGQDNENLINGDYREKSQILNELEKHKKELCQDGFIEWGLIFHDNHELIEIFIKDAKYIQFWGNDLKSLEEKLHSFNLTEDSNIEFIDEYPKVVEALWNHDDSSIMTNELVDYLKIKNCT